MKINQDDENGALSLDLLVKPGVGETRIRAKSTSPEKP